VEQPRHRPLAEVTASVLPLVVLVLSTAVNRRRSESVLGEDANHLGAPVELRVDPLDGVGRGDRAPVVNGKVQVGEHVGFSRTEAGAQVPGPPPPAAHHRAGDLGPRSRSAGGCGRTDTLRTQGCRDRRRRSGARGCWRQPGSDFGQRVRSPISAGWHRCRHPPERSAVAIGSTMAAIGTLTARSGEWSSCVSPPMNRPGITWLDAPRRACRSRRSSGASSATSLAKSIASSCLELHSPPRLDKQ
jgi:hypothetical protein